VIVFASPAGLATANLPAIWHGRAEPANSWPSWWAWLVAAAVVWVGAALFARPRFVVPPALRRPPDERTAERR
jgi:hypothetical protein